MTELVYSTTEEFSTVHFELDDAIKELTSQDGDVVDNSVVYIYKGEVTKVKYSQFFPEICDLLTDSVYDFAEEQVASDIREEIEKRGMNLNLEFSNFLNAWCDKNIKTSLNYITNVKEIAVGIHSIEEGIFLEMPNL